jgi:hypothetical protein
MISLSTGVVGCLLELARKQYPLQDVLLRSTLYIVPEASFFEHAEVANIPLTDLDADHRHASEYPYSAVYSFPYVASRLNLPTGDIRCPCLGVCQRPSRVEYGEGLYEQLHLRWRSSPIC